MDRIHRCACCAGGLFLAAIAAGAAFGEDCPNLDLAPLSALLIPPPANDSKETLAELAELQDLDALRTAAQAERAHLDHDRTVERFLDGIGIKLNDHATIAVQFFRCVADSTKQAVDKAKLTFNRVRPYKFPNNGLHILEKATDQDNPSYPSEHAAYGMATGLLLAEMLPEKRADIIRRIEDYGYSRMLAGRHFRSDVYAGEIAGAAVYAAYVEAFRDRFAQAKDNLRKALGYP
jgi:acid phosphatase (class A)